MNKDIKEVFGQFAIEGTSGVVLYPSVAQAEKALAVIQNGAENRALATKYCESKGWIDKNKANKSNIITAFLSWVDAGAPEAPKATDKTPAAEEATKEVPAKDLAAAEDTTEAPVDAEADELGDDEITF